MHEQLNRVVIDALGALGISADDGAIEHPAELSHGDYATGIALRYAKEAGKAPHALAAEIVAALGAVEGVARTEVAGPGFINFTLAPETVAESVACAREEARWGAGDAMKHEEVLLEYTSPNLFKPLHVGNLVGNIVGESLARLYVHAGATVRRINYPSDIGLTVAKGVWGLRQLRADPDDIHALGEAYRTGNAAYEDGSAKAEIDAINKTLYLDSDPELSALRRAGLATSKRHLETMCARLGTTFDFVLYESEAGERGRDLVLAHVDDGIFEQSEGAIIYAGEKRGLHTRVFVNSAGLPTYEAKDLGNFDIKTNTYGSWSRYVVVTGREQTEYFKVVMAAIREVFRGETEGKRLEHVATGFLTPTTGKMSSRVGNVITGESLLDELEAAAHERAQESRAEDIDRLTEQVAVAAVKYQILKQSTGKDVVFDKARALSLEGDSGPYLQYAHARAHQVVARAKEEHVVGEWNSEIPVHEVARLVHRFPEMTYRAAVLREPHVVANYLVQLAGAFNHWYAEEQILDGTSAASHKVALVDAVRTTLKIGLGLLGIPAPEKM